jgi:hypothetical protein
MKSGVRLTVKYFAALSLAIMFAAGTFGQAAIAKNYSAQKKLSQHEIKVLIASARTPEDHERIAQYYDEQSQYYLEQARAYAERIAAYERTPYLNSCSMCVTSSNSLEAAVGSLKIGKRRADEQADEMHRLAILYKQLARNANPLTASLGL